MQAEARQKEDKAEAQVNVCARGSHGSINKGLPSRLCVGGSGTPMTVLITSTTFERPALLVSEQSLWVPCPGPVILWTRSLLGCSSMYPVHNESDILLS